VLEHVLEGHLVVKGRGALEREEPRVFDDGGEEGAAMSFGGTNETLSVGLGRPFSFGLDSNSVGGVGGDGGVVRGHR
jgi:hypothetical protein